MLDGSALISILTKGPGWEPILDKLADSPTAGIGAPTLAETGIVLTARIGADGKRVLSLFALEADLAVVPFGEDHWRAAVDAYRRYGKGQHRAGLNFGDCLAYATAKLAGQPLLCTGADFAKTDLAIA
ncbi:MAG: type II toxin-antitoxin system VapC family toxin [Thermoanaerobaculia bacterium]